MIGAAKQKQKPTVFPPKIPFFVGAYEMRLVGSKNIYNISCMILCNVISLMYSNIMRLSYNPSVYTIIFLT